MIIKKQHDNTVDKLLFKKKMQSLKRKLKYFLVI